MITAGPFSQSDGPRTISLGREADSTWHEVAISFFDANGDPVADPTGGTFTLAYTPVGGDKPELLNQNLTVTTDQRRWSPFFGRIKDVIITPQSLPSGVFYVVTIVNNHSPAVLFGIGVPGTIPVAISPVVQRHFTQLLASGQKHYQIPTVTATGDFELEFEYYGNDSNATFIGADSGVDNRIFSFGSSWFIDHINVNLGSNAGIINNQINRLRVERVGSTVTGFVNGVQTGSGTSTKTFSFSRIGSNATAYTNGITPNVNFVSGFTQTGNPAGNPEYDLRENWVNSTVVRNVNATLGTELISTNPADWTLTDATITFTGNRVRVTNTANTRGVAKLNLGLPFGRTVIAQTLNRTTSPGNSGEAWISSPFLPTTDLEVAHTFVDGGSINLRCNGTNIGDWVEFDIPSVREAPGYGTAVNITSADAELFTESDTEFVGQHIIPQPVNLNNDWLSSNFATVISNNQWRGSGDGGRGVYIEVGAGNVIRISANIETEGSDIQLKDSNGADGGAPNIATGSPLTITAMDHTFVNPDLYVRAVTSNQQITTINALMAQRVLTKA